MHRSYSLAQPGSLMRAFCLFVLLIGVQFTALTGFVVARGATNTIGNPKLASNKPQVLRPQHTKAKSNPHAHMVGPDLGISILPSSPSYNVGDTVSYTLTATNGAAADPILTNPITITDVIPTGLSTVTAVASPAGTWSFTGANSTSPSLITATYTGPYPIAPGATLPTIGITGTANGQSTGLLTNVATVTIAGDLNLSNNTSTVSVNITQPATPVASVIATVVASVTAIPTIVATVTAIPTIVSTTPIASTTATVVSTTPIASTTATAVSTTPIASTTATAVSTTTPPDITVSENVEGTLTTFQVGQPVTYDLVVTNSNTAGPTTGPVEVSDVVPLGLTNLTASGTGWTTSLTDTVGPALMTASYSGIVTPGETLPPLHLTGVVAPTASSTLSNTAQAFAAGNSATTPNSNVSVINVLSELTPTSTVPCTMTSITLPCMATATAVTCLTPVAGSIGITPIATATSTAIPTTACPSGPDVSISEIVLSGDPSSGLSSTLSSGLTSDPSSGLSSAPSSGLSSAPSSGLSSDSIGGLTSAPGSGLTSTPSSGLTSTLSNNVYSVGDHVTYVLFANALTDGGSVTQPVTMGDVLPAGATDIHVSGSNWSYSVSNKTSPSVITATYAGPYPMAAGTGLSPMMVSLTLTSDAVNSFTTTATVDTLGDINLANNTYTSTLFVQDQNSNSNSNNHNHNNNNNNNQNDHNNNNNNNQNNHNNNHNNNNNQNNQNNNNYHAPGLPGTGSDPNVRIAERVE